MDEKLLKARDELEEAVCDWEVVQSVVSLLVLACENDAQFPDIYHVAQVLDKLTKELETKLSLAESLFSEGLAELVSLVHPNC